VATRLVDGSDKPVVEKSLMDPESFHNIQLGEAKWGADTNYKMFKVLSEFFVLML
jgi:hypothetical protein